MCVEYNVTEKPVILHNKVIWLVLFTLRSNLDCQCVDYFLGKCTLVFVLVRNKRNKTHIEVINIPVYVADIICITVSIRKQNSNWDSELCASCNILSSLFAENNTDVLIFVFDNLLILKLDYVKINKSNI